MPSTIRIAIVHPSPVQGARLRDLLVAADWEVAVLTDPSALASRAGDGPLDLIVIESGLATTVSTALAASGEAPPRIVICPAALKASALMALPPEAGDCVADDELYRLERVVRRELAATAARRLQREASEELRRLRKAVEASGEVVFLTDRDGVFTYVNPEFTRVYGYASDEVVGHTTPRILKSGHLSDEVYRQFWTGLLSGHIIRGELLNRRKDGSLVVVEGSANPVLDDDGRPLGFLAVQRDIAERKAAEERLRLSDEILSRVPSLVLVADRTGSVSYISPSVTTLLGFAREELLGDGWWQLTRPDPSEGAAEKAWTARRAAGENPIDERPYDRMLHARQGQARWIRFQDVRGPANTLIGVGQDITAARLAEDALRDSEARYRSLYSSMSEGVALHRLVYDPDGRAVDYVLLDVNAAYETIVGLGSIDVVGRRASDIYGQRPAPYLATYAEVAETGQPVSFSTDYAPLGKRFRVSVFSPARGQFATVFEDITEHARLEERFRQAQKMEAVGRLAGGIAHDFNNLLTAMLGYADLVLNAMAEGDPLKAQVQEIRKSGERASALTSRLLTFSRKQVLEARVVDLNGIVTGMVPMLRRVIGEDIELVTSAPGEPNAVTVDPNQVEQVILNLAVNARDAMPRGGRLTVETAEVEVDEHVAAAHIGAQAGRYVMLAISDTGVGMDKVTQSHLFEPFFTTKEPGKGTGLGLSTVYGIVNQSGGFLTVYSEVDRGTTFKVYLPRSAAHVTAGAGEPRPAQARGGTETVLLAEDEEAVRDLVRTILEQQGYAVIEARDGAEAIALCRQHQGDIHLLVSDVVMPQMSGPEMAGHLLELRPALRTLFLSGYTDEAVNAHGVLKDANFLQKPFKPVELVSKVREVLDRAAR